MIHDVWLPRLSALLAQARGDQTGYRAYRDRARLTGARTEHPSTLRSPTENQVLDRFAV